MLQTESYTDMKKTIFVLFVVLCFGCSKDEPAFSLVGKTYSGKSDNSTYGITYVNFEFSTSTKVNITFHDNSPISISNSASNNTRTYTLDYPNITISGGITGKFISDTELMLSTDSNHYFLQ